MKTKTKQDNGKFTFYCNWRKCKLPATCRKYGMDRCDRHKNASDVRKLDASFREMRGTVGAL